MTLNIITGLGSLQGGIRVNEPLSVAEIIKLHDDIDSLRQRLEDKQEEIETLKAKLRNSEEALEEIERLKKEVVFFIKLSMVIELKLKRIVS